MNNLFEMFSYAFMVRALVAGILIALCAALIGVPLVLRKNSMIGDGLSHVAFGAFAIAACFGLAPLWVALPVVALASIFILRLNVHSKISGDSAIALISISSLALGTFVVSLAGSNVDINNYLFGSILSIGDPDIVISAVLTLLILMLFVFSYRQIFAVTFDESFARAIGIRTNLYNLLFAILCSITIVLGMRLMGALLISGLVIFPALSARVFARSYRGVVLASIFIGLLGFVIGLMTSYLLNTPTGATIILDSLIIFIFVNLFKKALQ